jgi:hypothetical protein
MPSREIVALGMRHMLNDMARVAVEDDMHFKFF